LKHKPPVAAELSWPQVHAFRLARHHLLVRAPIKDLVPVVGNIGGVQAQVMSAAELQVGVRVKSTVKDVRIALWTDKTLVKTWLMRGTLHLVPAADLPLYTAAMHTRWIRPTNAWLKFYELTEPELWMLVDAIGNALDDRPRTREDLIATVGQGRPERIKSFLKSGWGGVLKPVARRGLLCFGPSQGQRVTFLRPQEWLGSWSEIDSDAALVEVARRYLRAYGPATKFDFARWWGNWSGVGNAAWAGLAEELLPVLVEGRRMEILASDIEHVSKAADGPSLQLLPAFDPYLLGHDNRDHLYEAVHRARVSRTAGWISAVLLIDGRVAATWSHTVMKQTLRIIVDPLQRLPAQSPPEIRKRAEELAVTLGVAKVEVSVA
jgi:hypothetical protein